MYPLNVWENTASTAAILQTLVSALSGEDDLLACVQPAVFLRARLLQIGTEGLSFDQCHAQDTNLAACFDNLTKVRGNDKASYDFDSMRQVAIQLHHAHDTVFNTVFEY